MRHSPLSSDLSSRSHGYGEPKLGEMDINEKYRSGDDVVTDDDPSSCTTPAITTLCFFELEAKNLFKAK